MGKKLAVYSFLTLVHLFGILFCIYISMNGFPFLFVTLTIINFTLDTIYVTSITYYEYFGHHKSKWYLFLKDVAFKFIFVLGMMVCSGYWGLVYLGDKFMPFHFDVYEVLFSVYVHFIVSLVIFLDLFVTDHQCVTDYKADMTILAGFWVFYAFMLVTLAKAFGVNIYPFLNFHLKEIVMIYFILFMLSFNFYQLFDYIVRSKSDKTRATVHKKLSDRLVNSINN